VYLEMDMVSCPSQHRQSRGSGPPGHTSTAHCSHVILMPCFLTQDSDSVTHHPLPFYFMLKSNAWVLSPSSIIGACSFPHLCMCVVRGKDLFWIMVSLHGHLVPWLWPCGQTAYHGGECVVKQSCYRQEGAEDQISFKGMSQ
jgi:hypothetical protein